MSVTVEQFREYVGTKEDSDFVDKCLSVGLSRVEQRIGEVTTVPDDLKDLCVLAVASEWYHRRAAPGGVTQFASMDGTAYRLAKDTMTSTYAELDKYLGFAV
jgi:hypothetical protein